VRLRLLKTTVLAAALAAMWTEMPRVTLRLNIRRRLSLKCWVVGHEDLIRRAPDRLYLECFECGRETHGWTTGRSHRADREEGGALGALPISKRNHSTPPPVRSPMRQSLRYEDSTTDGRNTTIAA
jgi:hypothetical protein